MRWIVSWVAFGGLWIVGGVAAAPSRAAEGSLIPFPIDWARAADSAVDLARLLEAPAGKNGFLRVQGEHLVWTNGVRFRIWGANLCGPDCFPDKEVAPLIAADLARLGFNAVRFHHLDSDWGRSIFDAARDDTRQLSAENLDRLDFFIAELKQCGIYANLNLNVLRRYKAGDGVRDWKLLGIGKSATYFNPRLIELQHEYARQLLTHKNAYTGNEYRREPAVAAVEMVNENSVLEGWIGGRLAGRDDPAPEVWSPIPVSYAEELTDLYSRWLATNLPPDRLESIRKEASAGPDGRVARLQPDQFAAASRERFLAEARFYAEVESQFFAGMKKLLREDLGVVVPVVGTADHNDGYAAYAHLQAQRMLDLVDGHGYWEHPRLGAETWIRNTPMVNDPLDSTVVQFARSPIGGMPFTISEVNHPFPHEYAAEGFPILTAYALLHDWDGIYWFTWGKGRTGDPKAGIPSHGWFDFSNDPVKLAQLAASALMWHRHDIEPAKQRITRSYTAEQALDALRMDRAKERPFFTPGFARSTPLEHATRFEFADAAPTNRPAFPAGAGLEKIESDTGQLGWHRADRKQGVVAIDTPRSQGLIGFVKDSGLAVRHLAASVQNPFCSLVLSSLDGRPLAEAGQCLLVVTAKATNTGLAWKEDRQTLAQWGQGPVAIEPVAGAVLLRDIGPVKAMRVRPLHAGGHPMGAELPVEKDDAGWRVRLGDPPTTWCLIEIQRP